MSDVGFRVSICPAECHGHGFLLGPILGLSLKTRRAPMSTVKGLL